MASIITIAGEKLFAAKAQANEQLDIDTFIFANVPGQDATDPINREEGLPTDHVVHQQIVQQVGRINDNVVVYSTVLDSITGPFEFNWVGLYSSINDTLVAINHVPTTPKTATAAGVAGNTLNRNFGIEYSGIADLTGIDVAPETWQLDFTARLQGMDKLTQQLTKDMVGKDSFIDDGFKVIPRSTANTFEMIPGAGYVNGYRVERDTVWYINMTPDQYPLYVYADAYFEGDASSTWAPRVITYLSTDPDKQDFVDGSGVQHYMAPLAIIHGDNAVEDLRRLFDFKDEIKERKFKTIDNAINQLSNTSYTFLQKMAENEIEIETNWHNSTTKEGGAKYLIKTQQKAIQDGDDVDGEYEVNQWVGGNYKLINKEFVLVLKVESGTISAESFGLTGIDKDNPCRKALIKFFEMSSKNHVKTAVLPNREIYFNNIYPCSLESGCSYKGGRNTILIPIKYDQRVFYSKYKKDFHVENIKSYINESDNGQNNWIGGGYWLFENCEDFLLDKIEVSKSFGTGIKVVNCNDFEIKKIKGNYNGFAALEIQGCYDYVLDDYKFYYNGKFSNSDEFKPLPEGYEGAGPGGRGWVVSALGDERDQGNSEIKNGRVVGNSEYGIRCFAANTKGIKNLKIKNLYLKDNGHPAGYYGDFLVENAHGVDFLINSDETGESENIHWENVNIERSLDYGVPMSVDGLAHEQKNVNITLSGDAYLKLSACQLYGAKTFKSENLTTRGAAQHYAFGALAKDIDTSGDRAYTCSKFMLGHPTGSNNFFRKAKAYHSSQEAISGENGIEVPSGSGANYEDILLDGFYRGIINNSENVTFNGIKTVGSKIIGFSNNKKDYDGVVIKNSSFDSASPLDRAGAIGEGGGVRNIGISFSAIMPNEGYFKTGYVVFKMIESNIDQNKKRRVIGWQRMTTGTNHVINIDWHEMWVNTDETT